MQRILAHKIQTPGNHTKERIQHSQHSDSFKWRILYISVSHSVLTVLICLPEIQKFHCSIMLVFYSFFFMCEELVSKTFMVTNSIKLSQASSWVRWLKNKWTNIFTNIGSFTIQPPDMFASPRKFYWTGVFCANNLTFSLIHFNILTSVFVCLFIWTNIRTVTTRPNTTCHLLSPHIHLDMRQGKQHNSSWYLVGRAS